LSIAQQTTAPAYTDVIALRGLTKRYGQRLALSDVTLSIGPGVTGLLGPNGSGKSTLIKSLLGLLSIQAGTAEVLGYQLPRHLRAIRDAVGYLPEDDCFLSGLSGIESVQFMARLSGLNATEGLRRSHEVLDFSDVGQERYRPVETYSTGMRQKLKFAQAIVHDPHLLILDEPTTGLDPQQRLSMLRKIKTLAKQHDKSILISTHILHDVRAVCEQVVIMAAGQVRLVDSLENLSRPAQQGITLQVERTREVSVEQPYPEAACLAAKLQEHGMTSQVLRDGRLWVSGVDPQHCGLVWQLARDCNVHIKQLAGARNSLEQVFFEAVREAQHALA
jgi:ABC-2 type transport system ATP-binding protein